MTPQPPPSSVSDPGSPPSRLLAALGGRGDAAVHGHRAYLFSARLAQFDLVAADTPSAKMVLHGRVHFRVGRRTLPIDPGHFLLLNPGDQYAATMHDDGRVVDGFTVWFRPGFVEHVAASLGTPVAEDLRQAREIVFGDRLRPLTPHARELQHALRDAMLSGVHDDEAHEELLTLLLGRWLIEEHGWHQCAARLDAVRASTRAELLRRVGWATDFIISQHAEPLTIDRIAAEARLSKFHLIRLFREVHGTTPHQFLQAQRADAARRLLADADATLEQVAGVVGFGSRWTMQRALKRRYGASGERLRGVS